METEVAIIGGRVIGLGIAAQRAFSIWRAWNRRG